MSGTLCARFREGKESVLSILNGPVTQRRSGCRAFPRLYDYNG